MLCSVGLHDVFECCCVTVAFMRANIVGTVMVLSLIVWIPASCAIHHVDKKKAKQDAKERDWLRAYVSETTA